MGGEGVTLLPFLYSLICANKGIVQDWEQRIILIDISMKQLQRTFRVLGNARRFAIIALLIRRPELSVSTIARAIELSITATSRHLNALANVDLLDRRQESLTVYYRITDSLTPYTKSIIDLVRRAAA